MIKDLYNKFVLELATQQYRGVLAECKSALAGVGK